MILRHALIILISLSATIVHASPSEKLSPEFKSAVAELMQKLRMSSTVGDFVFKNAPVKNDLNFFESKLLKVKSVKMDVKPIDTTSAMLTVKPMTVNFQFKMSENEAPVLVVNGHEIANQRIESMFEEITAALPNVSAENIFLPAAYAEDTGVMLPLTGALVNASDWVNNRLLCRKLETIMTDCSALKYAAGPSELTSEKKFLTDFLNKYGSLFTEQQKKGPLNCPKSGHDNFVLDTQECVGQRLKSEAPNINHDTAAYFLLPSGPSAAAGLIPANQTQ